MTRQFNQQPRDDSRLLSRNVSSNRYQGEQYSRHARPRLNRAMVDRGWENGTPRHHPDYHPQSSNGQAPRNNGRNNQERGYSSYNGPVGSRTDGNRQPDYRNQTQRFEPVSESHSTSRRQPPNSRGYNSENRQGGQSYGYNNRRGQNNQRQPQGHEFNFRTQEHDQQRFNDYGYNRRQPDREHVNGYGNNHPQRGPERHKSRGYKGFNERSMNGDQEQRNLHPRLQSRPATFQRRQEGHRSQESQHYAPYREQFEGDYEQFGYDTPAQAEAAARKPFRGNRSGRSGQYQNSYTRKGPRLVSHKDDEFRAAINKDAEELVNRVHSSPEKQSPAYGEVAAPPQTVTDNESSEDLPPVFSNEEAKPSPAKKQTKRAVNAKETKKSEVAPPLSKGPRPSQRGYKWPTP